MFVAFMEEQENQLKCKKHNIVPCGINLNNQLPPSERIICSICLGFNQDKLIPNNGFQKCLKNIQKRQLEKMKFLQQNFPELILIEHLYNLNEKLQKDSKIKEARNEFKQKLCKYSFFEELKNYPNQKLLITQLEKDNTQNNVKLIWSKYNPIDFWIKSDISNMSKLNVSFNINKKEIQVYDEKFIRIEKDPLVLVLQNYEQFLYLKWVGQYNARLLKVGKWEVIWMEKIMGGGQFDNEGNQKKIGKWVELDQNFYLNKQVTENGEYNMSGFTYLFLNPAGFWQGTQDQVGAWVVVCFSALGNVVDFLVLLKCFKYIYLFKKNEFKI